jgi:hypothetical protein
VAAGGVAAAIVGPPPELPHAAIRKAIAPIAPTVLRIRNVVSDKLMGFLRGRQLRRPVEH